MKLTIIISLLIAFNIYSQSLSQYKGSVKEKKDSTSIIGASILLQELKKGTSTIGDGSFELKNIPAGTYTMKVTSVGHKTIIKKIRVPDESGIALFLEEKAVEISPVIVTSSALLLDAREISQPALSLSNLDLNIKKSTTIAQTLDFQPGISMRSNGLAPARPVIRGFSNSRILILEDGLRMGDLSNTSDDHGISNDLTEAEKIEILRGPSSLIYGSNAIGGVVNIITGIIPSYIPQALTGNAYIETQSVNNQKAGNLHINYGYKNISGHMNVFGRKGTDYLDANSNTVANSDIKAYGASGGFSYLEPGLAAGIGIKNYNSQYGLPYNTNEEDEEGPVYIDMKKNEMKAVIQKDSIAGIINTVSLKAGYDYYKHDEISKLTGQVGTSISLKTYSADLSLVHAPLLPSMRGIIGLSFLNKKYEVDGEEAFTPNADYTNAAAYFMEEINAGRLSFQFGARYENIKVDIPAGMITDSLFPAEKKSFSLFPGSLGIIYNLDESSSIFFNAANAYRSPVVEELSSFAVHEATGTFDVGSRALKDENSLGFDLGFRTSTSSYFCEISAYYNSIKNYIFRAPTDLYYSFDSTKGKRIGFNNQSGIPVYIYSQADAELYGFEAKAAYYLTPNFSVTAVADYVRGKNKSAGEDLPMMPPVRLSLEGRYVTDQYWFGAIWKGASEQKETAAGEEATKGYGVADIFGGFKFFSGRYASEINIKIENVLNQKYRDHLSAIKSFALMPGRNFSINYNFLF